MHALTNTTIFAASMDSTEAMAQISAVMSAPSEPVEVVVLHADGKTSETTIDHRKVTELLGAIPTFVGAIRALGAQAVARRDCEGKVNAHVLPDTFEPNVNGDIVLLRTAADAVGSPLALTLREYNEWVAGGMPDVDEDEEGVI